MKRIASNGKPAPTADGGADLGVGNSGKGYDVTKTDEKPAKVFVEWLIDQFRPSFNHADVPSLWHYTNGNALIEIVKNGELWATHASCLNDLGEIGYWLDMVQAAVEALLHNNEVDFPLLAASWSVKKYNASPFSNTFVCCFSEKPDDLGQWRAYANGEGGYAIEFDGTQLLDIANKTQIMLVKVNYDREYHKQLAADTARKIVSRCKHFAHNLNPKELHAHYEWEIASSYASSAFVAPMFKSDAFRDEQEWRLIINPSTIEALGDLQFMSRRVGLSMHFPLSLRIDAQKSVMPIRGVFLGPSRNGLACGRIVRHLLRQHGYPKEVQDRVTLSTIPYQSP